MSRNQQNTVSVQVEQKIIDAVRDRPCLWDKGHEPYKNAKSKKSAWTEVGSMLNMVGKHC